MSKKLTLLRWTINQAGLEFAMDAGQISKQLRAAQIQPGADGCFSTRDICAAVYGDIEAEQLRKVKHQANILELEEMEMRRQVIPTDMVLATWSQATISLRQVIWNSEIPEPMKRDLLDDLRNIPLEEYFNEGKPAEDEPA